MTNRIPPQTRRLSPDEVAAARRELFRAGCSPDALPGQLRDDVSRPTRRQDRIGLGVAAAIAFVGTVLVAAYGDTPGVRAIGVIVGTLIVVLIVALPDEAGA